MAHDRASNAGDRGGDFTSQMRVFGGVLLGALLIMLAIEFAGGWAVAGVQAYMHGDELWTHAQKEAVIHLIRYAETGDPSDHEAYRKALRVPLSYREARQAMQAPELDWARARAGLLGGGSRPHEVTKMIVLVRYFGFLPGIRRALDIWARGDVLIDSLQAEAKTIRSAWSGPSPNRAQIEASVQRVVALDTRLTQAERRFSETVYAWANRLRKATFGLQLFFALVSLAVGFVFAWRTFRRNRRWRAELEESEERYRNVVESAQEVIFQTDAEGRWTFLNPAWTEIMGYEVDESRGEPFLDFVHPEDRADSREAFRTLMEQKRDVYREEARCVTKSGDVRWMSVRARLRTDEEGTPAGTTGTLTDITERKDAEQVLRSEQRVLRQMYRITADREVTFEGKVHQLIDLGRDYLELPYGFLARVTNGTQEIVHASGPHPQIEPGTRAPISEAIQGEGLLTVRNASAEGRTDDPAREKFELETYIGSRILVEGEFYGTLCFAGSEARAEPFTDREQTFVELVSRWASYELEQQHAKKQLERQNERLDSFASVVSHDLRNPLNIAEGRLRLAREEGRLTENGSGHLAAVERALDRMNAIIEDVLLLTWGGQALGPEDLETFRLGQVVESCWRDVDTARATLHVEDDPLVRAEESRLRRLVENLFRNAIEHAGEEVEVWVGALDDGFYVEDDGPGIPKEIREEVFEAGYSTREEGTGLGLSIAKSIAEAHGWGLSVTDGRDGGARFEITGVDGGAEEQ